MTCPVPLRLVLLLLVTVPVVAQAQSVGVKAGLNATTIFFDDDGLYEASLDKRARLGLVGGLSVDVPFSSALGLRAEALYSQRGFANYSPEFEEGESFSEDGTVTFQMDYVEVPVLLNVTVPVQSGLEIGVQGGLVPAFAVREVTSCDGLLGEFEGEPTDFCAPVDQDQDFGIRPFDLGGALGATVGAGPFAVDLRYTLSLADINEELDPDARSFFFINGKTARHGVLSVTGVYRFGR
ncbi:MAG: porin family protein [Bacteroidota bacterium]